MLGLNLGAFVGEYVIFRLFYDIMKPDISDRRYIRQYLLVGSSHCWLCFFLLTIRKYIAARILSVTNVWSFLVQL